MNLNWLYEVPNWLSCLVIVSFTTLVGVAGLLLMRRRVRKLHTDQSHNAIVSYYLNVVGVLYGIALGLIAVATWQSYSNTEMRADAEAASLAALYHDVSSFPEPARLQLQQDLRNYTQVVIDRSWPQQRIGILPDEGTSQIAQFQVDLLHFEPATDGQKIIFSETLSAFNQLVELHRLRMEAAMSGLPMPVWVVVVAGAMITLGVTWFFNALRFRVHVWMTVFLSMLLGLIIQLMFRLDKPYRGQYGISPAAYETVYKQLMGPSSTELAPKD
jgi:Protein of unknown function (DUF4239)